MRTGVFDALLTDATPARLLGGIVLVGGITAQHGVRSEPFFDRGYFKNRRLEDTNAQSVSARSRHSSHALRSGLEVMSALQFRFRSLDAPVGWRRALTSRPLESLHQRPELGFTFRR